MDNEVEIKNSGIKNGQLCGFVASRDLDGQHVLIYQVVKFDFYEIKYLNDGISHHS